MRRTAIAAVLACSMLLAASLVSPAFGGPSIGSVAKTAKKALNSGKAAKRTADAAKRAANAAKDTAATANGKADQALARPVVTAGGITTVRSSTTFIAPGEVGAAAVVCPPGQRSISGGGAMASGVGDGIAVSEADDARSGWFVIAVNNSGVTVAELEAEAYCAPAGGAVAASHPADLRTEMAREARRIERSLDQ